MMKTISKVILAIFFTLGSKTIYAQQFKQEADLIRSMIGKEKKEFVQYYMSIPNEKNSEFWNIYNQYETERQKIGSANFRLINQYLTLLNTNNENGYKKLVVDITASDSKSDKLLKKYYQKVEKDISPQTALQFFQLEKYIKARITYQLYQQVLFAG
ncbi:hypothetical protein ACM46_18105 [Chryseobacterium angstadtii]|uniref:Sensor of ECF-type sigma factor n=1 Tax=Chryseobacterium angstadtii TaxID=558151 RepID=A0A0J7I155_9FLAO|nr:hypothetical protein [Chryseobacterium angstadtii]KMQ60148.1 hypothetical protein ACM46_18105 [Chryseobacterium angstadtii]